MCKTSSQDRVLHEVGAEMPGDPSVNKRSCSASVRFVDPIRRGFKIVSSGHFTRGSGMAKKDSQYTSLCSGFLRFNYRIEVYLTKIIKKTPPTWGPG